MQLSQVNTSDIRDAVELGCGTMSRIFNADDNDIPFFNSIVRPVAEFSFHSFLSESHVPGRHLNALLNAEAALGIQIDELAVEKHANAAYFSYGGPLALPLNREVEGGELVNFAEHNTREGFHALCALVKFRNAARARELAEASIQTIFDLWRPNSGWNQQKIEGELGLKLLGAPFIVGLARSIGPLVKYFAATGHAPALQLANILKDKAIGEYYLEDGEYHAEMGTHTHSVTCVLSSLAQLAQLTRDATLMERVKRFYDNGLKTLSNELGWSIEQLGPGADPDRGEVNNTGDIVETALILARWGYTDYYGHVERIVRGHILPSQLRDISFIEEPENPDNIDGKRDVGKRHRGAFGFPAPYGHQLRGTDGISFNLDIVGGTVASLCEVWRAISHSDERGHKVNLLFDFQNENLAISSPYTHSSLAIEIKKPAPLWVRMPSWVDRAQVEVIGAAALPDLINGYLFIPDPPQGRIDIRFPLVPRGIVMAHGTDEIRVQLKGDQVEAMENFGADLTFFPSLS